MKYKIKNRYKEEKFPTTEAIVKLLNIRNLITLKRYENIFIVFCDLLADKLGKEITVSEFYNIYGDLVFDIKCNEITEKDHPGAKVLTFLSDLVYDDFKMKIYIIGKTVFGNVFAIYFLQLLENVDHHVFTYMET